MPAVNESGFISCSLGGGHPCQHGGCLHILAGPTSGEQMESGFRGCSTMEKKSVLSPNEIFNIHLQRTLSHGILGELAPLIMNT